MKIEKNLYHYNAEVTEVYDGDTITVKIDLGLKVFLQDEKIRFYGINAPELRGPERPQGLVSRDFLREKILGKKIILKTIKDRTGKYGRYLGIIYLEKSPGDYENINDLLVDKGMAVYHDY